MVIKKRILKPTLICHTKVFEDLFDIENSIIFEIGVGALPLCRTLNFINTTNQCYLFEPNPSSFTGLKRHLGQYDNFHLFNIALGNINRKELSAENNTCEFILDSNNSYIEGIQSPCLTYWKEDINKFRKIKVPFYDITDYDEGNIDFLYLDTEGSEYFILEKLVSRPKGIVVELRSLGCNYTHKYFHEINKWMDDNNYDLYKIISKEDYIFIQSG